MKFVNYCIFLLPAASASDVTAAYLPAAETYYPAYPSYPSYPADPYYPAYPSYPTYPTWPSQPSWPSWPSQPSWPSWPSQPSWPSWPSWGGCSSHSQCGSGQYCYSCSVCMATRGCSVTSTCRMNPSGGECAPIANCNRDNDPIDGRCPVGSGGGSDPCWPNPCSWNERCVAREIYCIRAPCPQYTCVPRVGGGGGGGSGSCGANEEWTSCASSSCWENTCSNSGAWPPQVCTADCKSGCRCREGYKRNYNGQCTSYCYVLGRPYTTEKGEFLIAPVATGSAVASNTTHSPFPEEERIKAAEYWAKIAMMEHASVASFSRFSMELMSIGAPVELLSGAHNAALDEVRHTQISLDIANEFGTSTFTPGSFPISNTADFSFGDKEKIAVAAAMDGCIEETLAASVVFYQAEQMENPKHKAMIHSVAIDEANHAAYAWRVLQWMISSSPNIHDAVAAVFNNRATQYESFKASNATSAAPLQRLGLVDKATTAKIQFTAWNEIVAPAAAQLGLLPRDSHKIGSGPIADVIRAAVH